jgi:ornithine cyclodeaminase
MTDIAHIQPSDVTGLIGWHDAVEALHQGHLLPAAIIDDLLLQNGPNSLLNRAAWIDGLGIGMKSVSVFPSNAKASPARPTVQGAMLIFDEQTGALRATIDGGLVTHWKTAADSMLGARLLARPDAGRLLIVGAGAVASSLIEAWCTLFPNISQIRLWNRNRARAEQLAAEQAELGRHVEVVDDLPQAAAEAELISCATLSATPVLFGEWIQPGTHVDLIGAFRPDMREADDTLLQKAELFVDSRQTTFEHIGELKIPLLSGAISEQHVLGDLYELCQSRARRSSSQAVTVFKNGGGAHLDLMIAQMIYRRWQAGIS